MRWLLVAVVVAAAVTLFVTMRTDTRPDNQRPAKDTRPDEEDAAGAPAPMLAVSGAENQRPIAAASVDPAAAPAAEEKTDGAPVTAPDVAPGAAPAPEGEGGKKVTPGARRLRPGETFTPFTALKGPTKEERAAAAEKTREILRNAKPARATWSDAPLQDVLRQLSKETGLVLALGPRALSRGMKIRVSDPLGDAAPGVDPTVWNILGAVARQHRFVLTPWKKGALLREAPDPEERQLCIHVLGDLVQTDWDKEKGIDAEDRLAAVFQDLVRDAAALQADSTVTLRGQSLIVRSTRAAQDRIGKALDTWRADPKRFQQDYRRLIAKRHPTVSGAPPRTGSKDEAGNAGK